MRAMILAAGLGERLRPLTETVPKALVPAGDKPLIVWHLERLARAGVHEVVINVSHLADRIEAALGDGAAWRVAIRYSREAVPLETAGGIAQARALLGESPFLLVNADVYCEIDLAALAARAPDTDLAHLVLVPNPLHRPAGDFALAGNRVSNDGPSRYTYAGIASVSPTLVDGIVPGARAPLAPLLREAAARGRLGGEVHHGAWFDVGTPERLAALNRHLARVDGRG